MFHWTSTQHWVASPWSPWYVGGAPEPIS